jgi:hypothetical protein
MFISLPIIFCVHIMIKYINKIFFIVALYHRRIARVGVAKAPAAREINKSRWLSEDSGGLQQDGRGGCSAGGAA